MVNRILGVFVAVSIVGLLGVGALAAPPLTVTSPDGALAVSFQLKSLPQPYLLGLRA